MIDRPSPIFSSQLDRTGFGLELVFTARSHLLQPLGLAPMPALPPAPNCNTALPANPQNPPNYTNIGYIADAIEYNMNIGIRKCTYDSCRPGD